MTGFRDWSPFWIAMLAAFTLGPWLSLSVFGILALWTALLVVAWQFVPK